MEAQGGGAACSSPASSLLSLIDLRVKRALKGWEGVPPLQSRLPGYRNADPTESSGASGTAVLALTFSVNMIRYLVSRVAMASWAGAGVPLSAPTPLRQALHCERQQIPFSLSSLCQSILPQQQEKKSRHSFCFLVILIAKALNTKQKQKHHISHSTEPHWELVQLSLLPWETEGHFSLQEPVCLPHPAPASNSSTPNSGVDPGRFSSISHFPHFGDVGSK